MGQECRPELYLLSFGPGLISLQRNPARQKPAFRGIFPPWFAQDHGAKQQTSCIHSWKTQYFCFSFLSLNQKVHCSDPIHLVIVKADCFTAGTALTHFLPRCGELWPIQRMYLCYELYHVKKTTHFYLDREKNNRVYVILIGKKIMDGLGHSLSLFKILEQQPSLSEKRLYCWGALMLKLEFLMCVCIIKIWPQSTLSIHCPDWTDKAQSYQYDPLHLCWSF